MKTLKALCRPRQSVFDSSKRDTVLDLTDLIERKIDAPDFFAENHITEGMHTLLVEGFRRLEGKSAQGVFKLTQAMGGGKTHSILAFGLLADHPELREPVMGHVYRPEGLGKVRVVGFSGRESDVPLGLWGSIAEQLGKKDLLKDYYSPLQAPGQKAWVSLLKGDPTLILLDELPPYLVSAKSRTIGNSDLASVTATALSNLMVAVGKGDLANVCVVLSDLTGSYAEGVDRIASVLNDLSKETDRGAMNLEPVRINTDEFYHILRKRIFVTEELPSEEEINQVAQGYAKAVRDARQMDITNESPEQFAQRVRASYPFHPAIKDLYARFRENSGFQQTRGLIRLMRIVTARLWSAGDADHRYLVSAHDIDMNDRDTLSEINQVNPNLENAVAHDIASAGNAVAEIMDRNLGGTDARDTCRLLLLASLANVPNAVVGLSVPEIVANLCAPGRDLSRLKTDVLEKLATAAWYLHSNRDGKLYFKNVQNLIAKLESTAGGYIREQSVKELTDRLEEIFRPTNRWCYQDALALPAVDAIQLSQDKTTLVIAAPTAESNGLNADLRAFHDQATWRNRVAFLTGARDTLDSLLTNARRVKAIRAILDELDAEKVPDNDPQRQQANELKDRILTQFHSAVRESFTTLYFPTTNGLLSADVLMKFDGNKYDGEEQIRALLTAKQKFTEEISGDTFRKKCEQRLFTTQTMLWSEIKKRAATQPNWPWHLPNALDNLKADCIHKDYWRDEEGGYVRKGPFAKGTTEVRVQENARDPETGRVKLKLTAVNADALYAEVGAPATTASQKVDSSLYETDELRVSFLAVDSTNQHPPGAPFEWTNRIELKQRVFQNGDARMIELKAAPPVGKIHYTTDGSDPKLGGGVYAEPFAVPRSSKVVLAYAEKDGVESKVLEIPIDWSGGGGVKVDPLKPAVWKRPDEVKATNDTYKLIDRLAKTQSATNVVRLTINDDRNHWVELTTDEQLRLDAAKLKGIIDAMRSLIGGGQVDVAYSAIHFPTGQNLLDWVAEAKTELKAGEVEQYTEETP